MTRALVLSGGGLVGGAWQAGLATGLLRAGIDLRTSDVILGTSAGSYIGARLALGHHPGEIEPFDFAADPAAPGGSVPPDAEAFQRFVTLRRSVPKMDEATARQIGELAVAARTVAEGVFLENFRKAGVTDAWPEKALVISAVNCRTGKLVALQHGAGISLVQAAGASCGAPGYHPAVVLNGVPHVDGGVYSGTCCELLLPFRPTFALILRVLPGGLPAQLEGNMRAETEREAAMLEAAGCRTRTVFPDAAVLAVMGPNLLAWPDPEVRRQAEAQGAALAPSLRPVW